MSGGHLHLAIPTSPRRIADAASIGVSSRVMRTFLLLAVIAIGGCGQRQEAAAPTNETARITDQIDRQAKQIADQAENGTAAIERALENEGAAIFDNRAALLNEAASEPAAGNRSR